MRKLLYVPIIHSEADLGSLGAVIDRESASLYGEKRWTEHKETVARLWESIANYLLSLDAANLIIYQDGLAADGELGRRIIEEASKRGSTNHQIILQLRNNGAEVRKTEDAPLLMEELGLACEESGVRNTLTRKERELKKSRLTKERDQFIARTINETLGQGEIGLLFIGAYHNVQAHLSKDIAVEQLKEQNKLKAYFAEFVSGRSGERLKQLAQYLTSPITLRRGKA